MLPQLNFIYDGGILVFVLRPDPQQIIQANFSVNKTIPMTEEFICKDHAVYCIILHFCRSTRSACYIHIYIIIGHALLLKHKHPCEQVDHYHYAYPLIEPLRMH